MKLENKISKKIKRYHPAGLLDHTTELLLNSADVHQHATKKHMERVALLSEAVAKKLKKDAKAAFFGGLLHDIGKIIMSPRLFDGHDITNEEYREIKDHALNGYKILKDHLLTACCAGSHHSIYKHGYGLFFKKVLRKLPPRLRQKFLDIITIVSICDYIDAFKTRAPKHEERIERTYPLLKDKLEEQYSKLNLAPNLALTLDTNAIIEVAIKIHQKISKSLTL